MNTTKRVITLLLTCIFCALTTFAQKYPLSTEDKERLNHAIELVDQGQTDSSLIIIESLLKKYPKDYLVNYEYTYTLCQKGEFKKANKVLKKLEKYPEASDRLYQMIGNTYDYMGEPENALKAYQRGLKKFPNSGPLYAEQGNVYFNQSKYDDALSYYEKGVEVDPMYPTSYLRAATLYLSSNEPIWGMIYAEMFYLLKPLAKENSMLCNLTLKAMRDNFKMEGDSLHVTLTHRNNIYWNSKKKDAKGLLDALWSAYACFEIRYESVAGVSARINGFKDTIDFNLFCKIREGIADSLANTDYSCGLFKFHKKIIEAGFWECYNMAIYNKAFPTEFEAFMANEENVKKITSFMTWYNTIGDYPNPNEPTSSIVMERQLSQMKEKKLEEDTKKTEKKAPDEGK